MFEQQAPTFAVVTPETLTANDPRILAVAGYFGEAPEEIHRQAITAYAEWSDDERAQLTFDEMITAGYRLTQALSLMS